MGKEGQDKRDAENQGYAVGQHEEGRYLKRHGSYLQACLPMVLIPGFGRLCANAYTYRLGIILGPEGGGGKSWDPAATSANACFLCFNFAAV